MVVVKGNLKRQDVIYVEDHIDNEIVRKRSVARRAVQGSQRRRQRRKRRVAVLYVVDPIEHVIVLAGRNGWKVGRRQVDEVSPVDAIGSQAGEFCNWVDRNHFWASVMLVVVLGIRRRIAEADYQLWKRRVLRPVLRRL